VPQDFLRKHDTLYKGSNDSSYRIMMATGQLTSQEDYNRLPPNQQAEIASAIEKKQKGTILRQTLDDLQKEIDNYVDNNAKSGGAYTTTIDRLKGERQRLQEIYNKDILGISDTSVSATGFDQDAERIAQLTENIKSLQGASQYENAPLEQARLRGEIPSDADIAESERRYAGLRPYAMIAALGGEESAEKFKEMIQSGNINESEVKKLIDGASENQIQDLVSSPDVENIIKTMIAPSYDVIDPYPYATRKSDPYDSVPFAVKVLKSRGDQFTQSQKRESIKVLKSKLPSIILRYTQP
jgi:hypothetical protein